MKIRRYVGQDINEAMLKVKLDLGDNAVVVSTGTIKQKGFWGFFKKPEIEVLAILDENDNKQKLNNNKNEEKRNYYTPEDINEKSLCDNKEEEKENNSNVSMYKETEVLNYEKSKVWKEDPKLKEELQKKDYKINELENKINKIEMLLENINLTSNENNIIINNDEYKPYQLFTNSLLRNEVEPQMVKKVVDNIKTKVGKNTNVSDIAIEIDTVIKEFLGEPDCIEVNEYKKAHIILFAGPTGVGKTTTIAKIASDFALKKKKSVALITADTYRIAAVEQLKTYAQILNIPLKIIYSPAEISTAIKEFSDKDIILVDTAGRNHKDKQQFENLKELVFNIVPDETYLLISANTGIKDCQDIISHYNFLPNYKILFTKLDETSSYGIILNVRGMTDRPLSYVTTGQNVPDDIETINIEKISKVLLGSNLNE